MKQEYVLPKLRVPGHPNWLVRGLWVVGGIVTVWLSVLAFAIWKRTTQPLAATTQAVNTARIAPPPAFLPPTPPATPTPATPIKAPAVPTSPTAPGTPAANTTRPLAAKTIPGRRLGGRGYGNRGKLAKAGRYGQRRAGVRAGARGRAKLGGGRALAARKAMLRKKRLAAARGAARPAVTVEFSSTAAAAPRRAAPRPAGKGKGDAIDEILRNFK